MTNKELNIRTYHPGDLDKLQDIRARAFKPVFRSFREILGDEIAPVALANAEKEQQQLLSKICAAGSLQKVYVAAWDTTPVGFVSVSMDNDTLIGEVMLIAVDPEYAAKGIGTRLCEHALQAMRAAGMKVATVGTGADLSHTPARRAYEKAGFGPTLPNQWMYRKL